MLATIGLGFALTVVGFKVVVPEDPYAHLDDTYLSTLKDDDDRANAAAQKVLTCLQVGLNVTSSLVLSCYRTLPPRLPQGFHFAVVTRFLPLILLASTLTGCGEGDEQTSLL